MGTRADFYVSGPEGPEWLGSIAWDGYCIDHVAFASTEEQYRQSLEEFFAGRDDVTRPEQGWPWPWDTSDTTDFGYVFVPGQGVVYSSFGGKVFRAADEDDEPAPVRGMAAITYPNMAERRKTALSGERSGLIVLSAQ